MKFVTMKNGKELQIRRATEDDAECMARFKAGISGESDFLSYGENEIVISAETERDMIRAHNETDNSVVFIALLDGEIAGFVNFRGGARLRKRHEGEMGISVRQKYWGLGIGNQLMDVLIDWARETKIIRKINLLTRADNETAIRLYEKFGFQKEGLITRDLYIKGIFYDAFIMGLPVDN